MDFRLDSETVPDGKIAKWYTAYRLLCRKTVCIPEVALWFYMAKPMIRSCRVWICYAPIAWPKDQKDNQTEHATLNQGCDFLCESSKSSNSV